MGFPSSLWIEMKTADSIIQIVARICSDYPEIVAAYLFGSAARDDLRKKNDVDVAVLLDASREKSFPLLAFITRLEKNLGSRVDTSVLNRSGELLKYEVRRTGKLIFERSPELRKKFDILGRKSFEDFLYLHRRYVNAVLYGVENGEPPSH